ncbi:TPA: ATP-binding protein, partial [Citrobacter freundii]|nr:ATP-binding protein [Citrobacter freundii]
MIVNFGFRNFFSFKEGAEVTFSLEKRVLESIPNKNGISYILGIKGANGSGKTNIIRALGFIYSFAASSSDRKIDDTIRLDSFFESEEPSEFYIDFILDDKLYSYSFVIDKYKVYSERLTKKNKREVVIFERKDNVIENCLSPLKEIKKIKLRTNASLISLVEKFDFDSDMADLRAVNNYFTRIICNVGYAGMMRDNFGLSMNDVARLYHSNERLLGFAKDIIKTADPSITNISIIKGDDDDGKERYYPIFEHSNGSDIHRLIFLDESSGTQTLFNKMAMYWSTFIHGGILAIDEFDIHLHALLLPKIISLFENEKSNSL